MRKNPSSSPVWGEKQTKCVAALTQQGTPADTWGSSAALLLLLPLLLHLPWHSSAPPLPLYFQPASACQTRSPGLWGAVGWLFPSLFLALLLSSPLLLQHLGVLLMMPPPPSCGGKAVVFCGGFEEMLPCHYGFACFERTAVCQVGLVLVRSALKGPAGRGWAWEDLDSVKSLEKVGRVQGREQPLHWGHTTVHPTLVWVSKVTEKNRSRPF